MRGYVKPVWGVNTIRIIQGQKLMCFEMCIERHYTCQYKNNAKITHTIFYKSNAKEQYSVK